MKRWYCSSVKPLAYAPRGRGVRPKMRCVRSFRTDLPLLYGQALAQAGLPAVIARNGRFGLWLRQQDFGELCEAVLPHRPPSR